MRVCACVVVCDVVSVCVDVCVAVGVCVVVSVSVYLCWPLVLSHRKLRYQSFPYVDQHNMSQKKKREIYIEVHVCVCTSMCARVCGRVRS